MKKILVVDDEQDVQILFQQRFRREIRDNEFEFAFVLSGHDAIHYMDSHNNESVLVLSDINMPGMSGLELLKQIKQQYNQPSPSVMMITAYGDADNFNAAKKLGADDFLTKPVDFAVLKGKLNI